MRLCSLLTLVVTALLFLGGIDARGQATAVDVEKGKAVTKTIRYGQYVQYLPNRDAQGVLVIVHGMPSAAEAKNVVGLAEKFLERWIPFAEENRLIALAPAFDDENFDSVEGDHGGGYRGLFGRYIGADQFVNQIVNRYKPAVKEWDGRILLYGHSAGAQFANRYCVIHPNRVRAAAISAAGVFAQPDPKVHWPYGMAPWRTTFRWSPGDPPQSIDLRPNPSGWLRAATLPLTVIVGTADLEPQKERAGHTGRTRVEFAQQWVEAMNRLAKKNKKEGHVRFVPVEGVGHDSAKLTPAAQKALSEALKEE